MLASRQPAFFIFATALCWLAVAAAAQQALPEHKETADTSLGATRPAVLPGDLDSWLEKLGKARRDLDAADYQGVYRKTGKIQNDMAGHAFDPVERLPGLVAQTFLLRALAEQAEGKQLEALYDFHAARAIDPGVAPAELASYGAVGEALAAALTAEEGEVKQKLSRGKLAIEPPKQLEAVASLALEKVDALLPPLFTVEIVIDLEGRIRQPRLSKPIHPLLAIAVFGAVREARFSPARLDGHPVMIHYLLWLTRA